MIRTRAFTSPVQTARAAASVSISGSGRAQCKDCKGSSLGEHQRQRAFCKDCEGIGICVHGRAKRICNHCEYSDKDIVDDSEVEALVPILHDHEEVKALVPILYDI